MGNHKHEKDEHLERLWYMKEEKKTSFKTFIEMMGKEYNKNLIEELSHDNFLELNEDEDKISLTIIGENKARQLIRAHRIAERMLHDVVGGDFEKGACEFEHTLNLALVDSICTLLGHPKECPHGSPIPRGDCCKSALKSTKSAVCPLTELKIGQSARVAYVHSNNDQQLHKIDGLHIRPGILVKLHQVYPTFVIECEGAHIAIDENIANDICVWKDPEDLKSENNGKEEEPKKKKNGFKLFGKKD